MDLAQIDGLLRDEALLAPIEANWQREAEARGRSAKGRDRPTIPMQTYVRVMVLKHRCGWGYETLMREVSDSFHLRRFCLIPIDEEVPDESTVRKLTRRTRSDARRGAPQRGAPHVQRRQPRVVPCGPTDPRNPRPLGLLPCGLPQPRTPAHVYQSDHAQRMDWIETVNEVEKLGVKTIIAGHTDPAAPDNDPARLIEATRQYIYDFDEAVASSSGGGEVVSKMTAKYPDLGNPYTLWLAAYTQSYGDYVEKATGTAPTSFADFARRTAAAWAVDEAR